ncbi:hypothetical protein PC116_g27723 [Phytophthora cactorum]|uniref:Uncharacterized protein n=1 Tax=Phytophthora cactorum TaxID=29920 RepID=A0A8T1JJG2_9STRA|nr:hypothetical protein Pcac1_g5776 [Phytophthora cactorum]KAG2906243.1 hypothetical protein PC114_g11234 [Phytophthora cactorum]KAG2939368.1 hypothetical protein PC117_g10975 [Phytophthora cactorum]KAG2977291.1 hypothetical protein PC120_g25531 [Phytophthora cactorum]KAG3014059.1 hypothetical protein PC120_g12920 [Phytophthora cactorum]
MSKETATRGAGTIDISVRSNASILATVAPTKGR